ncbi:MAG: hypothetical protein Kow0065_15440 [Methylomicrobium sp.]
MAIANAQFQSECERKGGSLRMCEYISVGSMLALTAKMVQIPILPETTIDRKPKRSLDVGEIRSVKTKKSKLNQEEESLCCLRKLPESL